MGIRDQEAPAEWQRRIPTLMLMTQQPQQLLYRRCRCICTMRLHVYTAVVTLSQCTSFSMREVRPFSPCVARARTVGKRRR
jgi:hypothetical protein